MKETNTEEVIFRGGHGLLCDTGEPAPGASGSIIRQAQQGMHDCSASHSPGLGRLGKSEKGPPVRKKKRQISASW